MYRAAFRQLPVVVHDGRHLRASDGKRMRLLSRHHCCWSSALMIGSSMRSVDAWVPPQTQVQSQRLLQQPQQLPWTTPATATSTTTTTRRWFASNRNRNGLSTRKKALRRKRPVSPKRDEDEHDKDVSNSYTVEAGASLRTNRVTDTEDTPSNTNSATASFATSYHAPVMWQECIDALLECERGPLYRERGQGRVPMQRDIDDDATTTTTRTTPLIYVDGTLGGGGHSQALLERLQPGDIVFGCDVDPDALAVATERLHAYTATATVHSNHDTNGNKTPLFVPIQANFGDLTSKRLGRELRKAIASQEVEEESDTDDGDDTVYVQVESDSESDSDGYTEVRSSDDDDDERDGSTESSKPSATFSHTPQQEDISNSVPEALLVDGILLDLGVSSFQIDTAERGFAFMKDGPLDMRMNGATTKSSLTAAEICNEFDVAELKRIFRTYGDEERARVIAQAIVKHRPLKTTMDLQTAVASVIPEFARKGRRGGRMATLARVFQSLRIVVNQEDLVLDKALVHVAPAIVRPGGRLVVLSYHSMEDRATKRAMRDGTTNPKEANLKREQKDIYGNYNGEELPFKPRGKPRKATEEEIELNPRARSATLRIADRQEAKKKVSKIID